MLPGEDPGRQLLDTGGIGPLLTLLWLLLMVGWGAWRAWSQKGDWHGSLVEVGLLAVTGAMFVSAESAAAKNPARLIAWEWVGVLTAFLVVRQLVRSPRENRALLAAVLATGVSLSAYAVYQAVRGPVDPPVPDATVATIFNLSEVPIPADGRVSATFADPATFAGYLVLLTPALGMAWFLLGRGRSWAAQAWLLKGCLLFLVGALTLTRAWPAALALLITAIAFVLIRWRQGDGPSRMSLLETALLAGIVVACTFTLWPEPLAQMRWSLLQAAGAMIREQPAVGIGPGNFGGALFVLRPAAGLDKMATPLNFVMEIAATGGLFALAALLFAFAGFFWHVRSIFRAPWLDAEEDDAPAETPWEFYFGGTVGLTAALAWSLSGSMTGAEGLALAVRSLIWFVAFALLDATPWTPRALAGALVTGAAALLLYLLTAGGISSPALAIPLAVVMALALNALPAATYHGNWRQWLALILPMPLLAVVCLAYFLIAVHPALSGSFHVAQARRFYATWRDDKEPRWQAQLQETTDPSKRLEITQKTNQLLLQLILEPLRRAALDDPGNSLLWSELTYWHGKQSLLWVRAKDAKGTEWPPKFLDERRKHLEAISALFAFDVNQAYRADPVGAESYWVAYQSRLDFARAMAGESAQANQYKMARNNLRNVVERAPTSPQLHYLLAELSLLIDDKKAGKEQALRAQQLDEASADPRHKLSDTQRQQVRDWLAVPPG